VSAIARARGCSPSLLSVGEQLVASSLVANRSDDPPYQLDRPEDRGDHNHNRRGDAHSQNVIQHGRLEWAFNPFSLFRSRRSGVTDAGLPNNLRRQEASSTRTKLLEPCWNAWCVPRWPMSGNGKCRTTTKRAKLSLAQLNSSRPRSSPIRPSQRRCEIVTAPHRAAPRYSDIKRSRSDRKVFRLSRSSVVFTRSSAPANDAS